MYHTMTQRIFIKTKQYLKLQDAILFCVSVGGEGRGGGRASTAENRNVIFCFSYLRTVHC